MNMVSILAGDEAPALRAGAHDHALRANPTPPHTTTRFALTPPHRTLQVDETMNDVRWLRNWENG